MNKEISTKKYRTKVDYALLCGFTRKLKLWVINKILSSHGPFQKQQYISIYTLTIPSQKDIA